MPMHAKLVVALVLKGNADWTSYRDARTNAFELPPPVMGGCCIQAHTPKYIGAVLLTLFVEVTSNEDAHECEVRL